MPTASGKLRIALVIVILALAAFFRFYLITEVPPGLYLDEAANGNNAVEVLRTGSFKIFYPENNGREGLFINLQAIAIKLFGPEPWALRVVSAIIGTFTVLGLYLLTKELFLSSPKPETPNPEQSQISNDQNDAKRHPESRCKRDEGSHEILRSSRFQRDSLRMTTKLSILNLFRISDLEFRISRGQFIGLLSAFFLATSYWHINFSRIGFRAIMVPFFAVFGMYWLLKVLRTEKISSTVLAGIFTGLGFYTYIAFRFMPLVLAVPILTALVSWRRGRQAQRCVPCVVALFLFVAFIVALPIGFYFLQHPQDFFGRGGQVSIFSAQSPLYEFGKSTILTLGMFNVQGDCNQRHNLACEPQLFWPVGILFIIGLIITIRGLFKKTLSPIPYTLFAWFLFMMFPATLTREGLPHALRSIGLIPPVMILAGLGGAWLWQYIRFQVSGFRFQVLTTAAALLFLVWIPINTYRDYFVRFAYAPETQGAFTADLWQQGQYLAGLPDETKKIIIVNLMGDDIRGIPAPAQTIMFATDTFSENRRSEKNIVYVSRAEDIRIDGAARIAIIPMNPMDAELINWLRQHFPLLRTGTPGDFLTFEN